MTSLPPLLKQPADVTKLICVFLNHHDVFAVLFRTSNSVRNLVSQAEFWTVMPRPPIDRALSLDTTLPYIKWLHSVYTFERHDMLTHHRRALNHQFSKGDLPLLKWFKTTFKLTAHDVTDKHYSPLSGEPHHECNYRIGCGHDSVGGLRPLYGAVRGQHHDVVSWLLKWGAPDAHDLRENIAIACDMNDHAMAKLLLRADTPGMHNDDSILDAFYGVCTRGDMPMLQTLCEFYGDGIRDWIGTSRIRTIMNDTNNPYIIQWLSVTYGRPDIGDLTRRPGQISDQVTHVCGPLTRSEKKRLIRDA